MNFLGKEMRRLDGEVIFSRDFRRCMCLIHVIWMIKINPWIKGAPVISWNDIEEKYLLILFSLDASDVTWSHWIPDEPISYISWNHFSYLPLHFMILIEWMHISVRNVRILIRKKWKKKKCDSRSPQWLKLKNIRQAFG